MVMTMGLANGGRHPSSATLDAVDSCGPGKHHSYRIDTNTSMQTINMRQYVSMVRAHDKTAEGFRVGRAAEILGVSVETLRRWETEGRLRMERSAGGQRLVTIGEVSRLLDERRQVSTDRPIIAQSARNRFPGIVSRVERDGVAAVVEVMAGPHRIVSLMTAEAVLELGLEVGDEAVAVVKATNVIIEIPSAKESRG